MELLTNPDTIRALDSQISKQFEASCDRASWRMPQTSGAQSSLAQWLAEYFCEESELVVRLTDWNAPAGSLSYTLLEALLDFYDAPFPVKSASTYYISREDRQSLACLLALVMFFSWDAYVVSPIEAQIISLTNDEQIEFSGAESVHTQLDRIMQTFVR